MFWDKFLNLIFPSACLNCGAAADNGAVVCEKCFSEIKTNQTLFCGLCRARLPDAKKICHKNFPYILGAASEYGDETVRGLIHLLKFKYVKAAAEPLGELIARYLQTISPALENFAVVPIPLSKKRLRERGFNQSELIAKILAERLHLPLRTDFLLRAKHAKPQSETKNLKERRENVLGCFSVKSAAAPIGKNVVLVDDVTTSGATLFAAATALKNAGVKKIVALAAAKT